MQRAGSRRQRSLAQELQAGSLRQELQPQEQLGLLQVLQVQLPGVAGAGAGAGVGVGAGAGAGAGAAVIVKVPGTTVTA